MGRGLIIALAVSLALNVFAAGFISARLMGETAAPPPRRESSRLDNPFQLMRFAEALPEESREAFRAAINAELPALREDHKNARRLRRELAELMSRDEWDREKIETQMKAIRETQARQREAFDAAFVKAYETLSADERRLLVKKAAERRRGGRDRRRRDAPPPETPE